MYQVLMAVVAILPIFLLLKHVYTKDKHDKEPWWMVLKLFIYGFVACYIAYLAEKHGTVLLGKYVDSNTDLYKVIKTFVLVAFVEEFLKFFFLYIGSWRYRIFNFKYDAVIFAVFTSLGFALVENYLYIDAYGLQTGILRGITTVPMHAATAVFLGINYGGAKECSAIDDKAGKRLLLFSGLFIATLVHGVYNFCLEIETKEATGVFLGIVIILYIVTNLQIKKHSGKDKPILPEE